MPESRRRKKPASSPRPEPKPDETNPSWWAPVMVALMVVGLIWVVVTYIAQSTYPIPALGSWNLAVGFALILGGFAMAMRWR